jgi:CBS domain-containing protein
MPSAGIALQIKPDSPFVPVSHRALVVRTAREMLTLTATRGRHETKKNLAGACVRGRIQMTTVRQLLDQKGRNIWSIHPDATVFDAIAKMAEKDIGSLVVMEGDEFVGIITERHYARNVVLKGKTSPATPVRDIMERHVVIALPEQSVDQCMALMSEKRVRHLPVFEGKKPIGIVSIGDLVKSTIGDQKFMIDQLEHYIRGERANVDG